MLYTLEDNVLLIVRLNFHYFEEFATAVPATIPELHAVVTFVLRLSVALHSPTGRGIIVESWTFYIVLCDVNPICC